MTRPVVSIIVPMYQSAATVAETVRSVQADLAASGLDRGHGEIIVVNDGSRDDGPRIIERLAADDARIRMLSQANRGLAGARNTGLTEARGEWVRFLDADDLAVPGSTAKLIAVAERCGAACGSHHLIDETGRTMGRVSPAIGDVDGFIGVEELVTANRMGVGTVLIRRDLIGQMRFDEPLRVCEDWDFWLRLAQGGARWAVAPAWCGPMKLYRVRRGSLSKNFAAMLGVGSDVLRRAFARLGRSDDPRCEQAIRGQALAFASMQAVADVPDAASRARELLGSFEGLTDTAIAEAAMWGVLLGLAERPEDWHAERERWIRQLNEWWMSATPTRPCEARWQALARLIVPPEPIARQCIQRACDVRAREVVIAGLGHNGMRLADAAKVEGLHFRIRDDRLTDGGGTGLDPALVPLVQPMSTPIEPAQMVICSPENDEAILRRLPTATQVIRWREVRDSLAHSEQTALERCLLEPAALSP